MSSANVAVLARSMLKPIIQFLDVTIGAAGAVTAVANGGPSITGNTAADVKVELISTGRYRITAGAASKNKMDARNARLIDVHAHPVLTAAQAVVTTNPVTCVTISDVVYDSTTGTVDFVCLTAPGALANPPSGAKLRILLVQGGVGQGTFLPY